MERDKIKVIHISENSPIGKAFLEAVKKQIEFRKLVESGVFSKKSPKLD
jgi:hypothetical protein